MVQWGSKGPRVSRGPRVEFGQHIQTEPTHVIDTGLETIVSVVASFDSVPTIRQLYVHASARTADVAVPPGSFVIQTFKPRATDDVTPAPATDFSDGLAINWVAIGT